MTRIFLNPKWSSPDPAYELAGKAMARFRPDAINSVATILRTHPSFAATPFRSMDGLAARLGVGQLWAKDESARWGLGSFKASGGVYAILTLCAEMLSEQHRREIRAADILRGQAPSASGITFATATAGNHGCAVAYGAKLAGARSMIFVYDGVPQDRIDAIARWGADIVHVRGNYEAAHEACVAAAAEQDWTLLCDQAWPGYEEIPQRIAMGYSVLFAEVHEARAHPTHVFVQAGVGGLAIAAACFFAGRGEATPKIVVVEAETTPCLMESAIARRFVATDDKGPTIMGRLDCRVPSSVNWPILARLADAFAAVPDEAARQAMFDFAGEGIATSPSGAAGLAGLTQIMNDKDASAHLGLGPDSRVLVIASEKATAADVALLAG
jgi:diaminopropionate ammonia-lyase